MNVLFVGGVHGVGKSTSCETVAARHQCLHVRASDVIRQQKASAAPVGTKLVENVDANQCLLLRGFEQVKRTASTGPILLDGHFVLRDLDGAIQRLPTSVFAGLGLTGLLCFEDDPLSIATRMNERDQTTVDVDDIASLQAEELRHARDIASALALNLKVLHAFDVGGLEAILTKLRNGGDKAHPPREGDNHAR